MEITPELKAEGIVRELVHEFQNMRKDEGGEIDWHITARVWDISEFIDAVETHLTYFKQELLADEVDLRRVDSEDQRVHAISWLASRPGLP